MHPIIKKINEMKAVEKTRPLTEEENRELDRLRKEYVALFRESFRSTLLNTVVLDGEGREVTPSKLKQAQRHIKDLKEES
ncbi:MAG: DUF896 domain-containing protein [Tissierellia bacterium]|nr:DUF896 domain-containing protein [Tissierellia bacterium]